MGLVRIMEGTLLPPLGPSEASSCGACAQETFSTETFLISVLSPCGLSSPCSTSLLWETYYNLEEAKGIRDELHTLSPESWVVQS